MGRQVRKCAVRKWTEEEEEALCGGVAKHGPGKWTILLNDPKFGPPLINRSNVDLKDKWRNLVFHRDKEKLKSPKLVARKTATSQPTAATTAGPSAATAPASGGSSNAAMVKQPSSGSQDGKKPPQNKLQQHSAAGHEKKKKMKKKGVQKKSPAKRVKKMPLPSGGVRVAVVGTVRRSQRIMLSRFRNPTLPSNPDDPIVID